MLRHETTIIKQFDTGKQRRSTLQSNIDLTTDTMYDADATNSKYCDDITKIIAFITTSFSFIMIQMWIIMIQIQWFKSFSAKLTE